MGQGNSNRIACIVRKIAAIESKEVLQSCRDLIFACMTLAGNAFLDMCRRKFGDLNFVAANGCNQGSAGLTEAKC